MLIFMRRGAIPALFSFAQQVRRSLGYLTHPRSILYTEVRKLGLEDEMPDFCICCGAELEIGEFDECASCADANDYGAMAEFMEERFDMETEKEYKERKENRW